MPNLGTPSCEHILPQEIQQELEERVRTVFTEQSNGTPRIVQMRLPLSEEISPIDWLRSQNASEQLYWAPRESGDAGSVETCGSGGFSEQETGRVVAAVGAADVLTSSDPRANIKQLEKELTVRFQHTNERIRYYGGLRFDASHPSNTNTVADRWSSFGTYRFVLPRFELWKEAGEVTLACNLVLPRDKGRAEALRSSIHRLSYSMVRETSVLPTLRGRTDRPQKAGWTRVVHWALDRISQNVLDKVVLAREVGLSLGAQVDPFSLLYRLKEATPGCFHFAFSPEKAGTFLGASPERLFRCRGRRMVTEAVAGTGERGGTPEADALLRDKLLNSPKERREHRYVEDAIRTVMDTLCTSVEVPDSPSDLVLARGRHLHSRLAGRLKRNRSPLDVLTQLHPTPAVGGVPTQAALTAIQEQEPFDRGWYAGPVGWIGPQEGEFAVAIRSGVVESDQLTLFSGAGIVEGSHPEQEWSEIEQKIGDFAAVMGLGTHRGESSS